MPLYLFIEILMLLHSFGHSEFMWNICAKHYFTRLILGHPPLSISVVCLPAMVFSGRLSIVRSTVHSPNTHLQLQREIPVNLSFLTWGTCQCQLEVLL